MFVRYYNEGDPGGKPASADVDPEKGKKEPEGKEPESSKDKPKDKPEGKPKVDDTDYKALHEKAIADLKEFESGISPKLMKLADYEKAETERQAKTRTAEDDDLVRIDKRIADTKQNIALYKADKLDTMTLENDIENFEFRRKQIISNRALNAVKKEWLDFEDAHLDFKDYDGLNKIVAEAAKRKDSISPETAYRIWKQDQEITKAKESADIDKENKELGKKAVGEDGKEAPEVQGKSGPTWDFYVGQYGEKRAAELLGIKE